MSKWNKCAENQEFYRCSVCGNIVVKLNDSGMVPWCCGRAMEKIELNTEDDVVEKHEPDWEMDGCKLKIKIGSLPHPMEDMHYIQWIFVKTDIGFHVRFLSANDDPKVCFTLCKKEKPEYIYAYCNVHGLWVSRIDIECEDGD